MSVEQAYGDGIIDTSQMSVPGAAQTAPALTPTQEVDVMVDDTPTAPDRGQFHG